jgi:hypothetical protein
MAAGLDADQFDAGVIDERVEHAGGVAAAADAGDDNIGQLAGLIETLLPGLASDDGLEVAHDAREGVWPDDAAEDVVRRADTCHPVAQRLVDGVAQRPAARRHRDDLGAHRPHLEDVEFLPAHVLLAHVHLARQAEQGAGCCRGDAVLAGPRLGDDARLAHAFGEQRLADAVVDLVRPGVVEVLALEVHLRPAGVGGEALGEVERRGPVDAGLEPVGEVALELCIGAGAVVLGLKLVEGGHERFGDETPAVGAEPPGGVGESRKADGHADHTAGGSGATVRLGGAGRLGK